MRVGPIYPAGRSDPIAGRPGNKVWTLVQRLDRGDAVTLAADIAAAADGGATAVELVFAGSPTARNAGIAETVAISRIIADAPPEIAIEIDAGEASPERTRRLIAIGAGRFRRISMFFDPVATLAAAGGLAGSLDASAIGITEIAAALDAAELSGTAVLADGRPWHDAGASEVQELAVTVAAAVAQLRLLGEHGFPPADAVRQMAVALSADADQFLTIAKFRAIRLLLERVLEVAGIALPCPRIHAETAWRMLARRDLAMNMVRATIAAFAAAAGGADSITVRPQHLDRDPFADRMARNTQTILAEEALLYRVADPGAGSGAIETLTASLAEAAWTKFAAIEAAGGLLHAVRAGSIQSEIAAMQETRMRKVATRALPIVGVNVNVEREDRGWQEPPRLPQSRYPRPGGEVVDALTPRRLPEPFERLADRARRAGARSAVFFAGRPGDAAASASAADAFAAGGFSVVEGPELGSIETVGDAFVQSGASVACISPAPDDPSLGRLVDGLRKAGAGFVVIAGEASDQRGAAGVDAVLAPDTDLVFFFENTRPDCRRRRKRADFAWG